MSFILEDGFLGQQVDLLGRAQRTLTAGLPVVTLFTTNEKDWPAGSGNTFIAFCVIARADGSSADFPGPATARFNAPTLGVYDWCDPFSFAAAGPAVTIYPGTGIAAESDLTLLPGAIANGIAFNFTLLTWGAVDVPVVISAYGWAS